MKSLLILLIITISYIGISQTYNNPGGTISTCSGNFYDTGGSGGQYFNNEWIITTFCSSVPGQQIQVSFSSFITENGWDDMIIYDGPNTGSPVIGTYTGNLGAFTVTSTTGCLTFDFFSDATTRRAGWAAVISCITPPSPATYTHPTTGIANEFVGSCLVANCGPFTYADNGNVSANYANNINSIYRTFCPSVAGNCMSVTFNSFSTEATWDYLTVGNGPTQNSPLFTTAPANGFGEISGAPAVPFSYTSNDNSGCLTFRFTSDGSIVASGWSATLQCTPCAIGPNGTDNTDCMNMTPICSNSPISTMADGPGIVAEGCSGSACPAGGENHSNWYTFTAQTTGNLDVTVTPTNPADDYDFAIYGPGATCGALGAPLRCSDSGASGTTGAMPPGTGTSEDVLGDGLVSQLNVVAGQTYIMVVDKWSPSGGTGYTLSFGGSASLDCTILPIELSQFDAIYQPDLDVVDLTWVTASEQNSDYYNVEKSTDGINFTVINRINATGTTQLETQYFTVDENPARGANYYRLNMFDKDGSSKYSEIRTVNILEDAYDMLTVFPNPTSGITEVIFNSYTKEDVLLTVQSSSGAVVVNTTIPAKNGGNKLDLDMGGQAAGVYIVTVTTSNKTYKSKLVKN